MAMAMAAVVAAQVFWRYGLNASLFWSEELARHLLVWMTFLGASTAYRRRVHPGGGPGHVPAAPGIFGGRIETAVHLVSLAVFAVDGGLRNRICPGSSAARSLRR